MKNGPKRGDGGRERDDKQIVSKVSCVPFRRFVYRGRKKRHYGASVVPPLGSDSAFSPLVASLVFHVLHFYLVNVLSYTLVYTPWFARA